MGQDLRWVKPRWLKREYELHAGDSLAATLAWTRRNEALGRWAGGQYRFRQEGWLRARTLVYRGSGGTETTDEHAEPVATSARRGSTLTLSDGRTLLWKQPKRLTSERVWVDQSGNELVRFRPFAWTGANTVTIYPGAAPEAEVALVLLLGQYLLVLAAEEAAAAIVPVISG